IPRLPLLLLLLRSLGSHGFPATSETQEQNTEMVQVNRNHSTMIEKLKQMQEFFGLKVTGKIDADTLDIMRQSRCGVPDVSPQYGLTPGNPGWQSTHLTYRVENYTPDLSRADIEQAVEKAFQLWSSASPLSFTKVSEGQVDIMISFVWGDHCDNSPFDGPGGIFAHAFQPGIGIGGDVHLDEEEIWTKVLNNYSLYWVLAHELGHSFGLSHSTNIGALMYPNYIYTGEVYLSQDDISGIQAIYGPSNKPQVQTGKASLSVCECDNRITFDAVTKIHGELLFFKDRYKYNLTCYFLLTYTQIDVFHKITVLLNGVEIAYKVVKRDTSYFLKVNKFRLFKGDQMLPSYPKDIYRSFGFSGREEIGKMHFFVDISMGGKERPLEILFMDTDYPKEITQDNSYPWDWQKRSYCFLHFLLFFYFFYGKEKYKPDPKTKQVSVLLNTNSWFNCRSN
uniref:Peptidase metallopeptidase domain-containing protein n=1 Tax=Bos mutus grunniens TaxID=30521 RepID=A0A8B9Y241_BOSMU